jgi:hypothetical protein
VLLPLIVGGIIYICFRSESLRLYKWVELIGFDKLLTYTRNYLFIQKIKLSEWVIFSLPDGLWVYAFTSAFIIYWQGKSTFWLITPIILSVLIEISQAFKFIQGTFDFVDILFSAIAFIISYSIFKINYKHDE